MDFARDLVDVGDRRSARCRDKKLAEEVKTFQRQVDRQAGQLDVLVEFVRNGLERVDERLRRLPDEGGQDSPRPRRPRRQDE